MMSKSTYRETAAATIAATLATIEPTTAMREVKTALRAIRPDQLIESIGHFRIWMKEENKALKAFEAARAEAQTNYRSSLFD